VVASPRRAGNGAVGEEVLIPFIAGQWSLLKAWGLYPAYTVLS